MCVFLISPVPIAEPLTSELIDTPVFYNLAPRPIKYRVSVPIPIQDTDCESLTQNKNGNIWDWTVEFCAIIVVQVCINNARNISLFLKQSPF